MSWFFIQQPTNNDVWEAESLEFGLRGMIVDDLPKDVRSAGILFSDDFSVVLQHYRTILRLPPTWDEELLRKQYRKLIAPLMVFPNRGRPEEYDKQLNKLQCAYDFLSDSKHLECYRGCYRDRQEYVRVVFQCILHSVSGLVTITMEYI